ncbi:MAG: hypothetical protein EPO26_15580 [Chloroflexota bacterium]|nr:MAG: hypothetical protein EPO26_15580 [Chloroflexota bacterium]
MASLTLKNMPDDLLEALRRAAVTDRRSVTQEIIYLCDTALRERGGRPGVRVSDSAARLAAWRELAGKWESDLDPAAEAESIVSQRTAGRDVNL